MKKSHILLLILVAISIGVIMSFSMNASTYGNFTQAFDSPGNTFVVVGHLNKNKPIISDKPNLVEFYMTDKDSVEYKVFLNETKPQDFERSESIVITGVADKDKEAFMATKIQMKCPSKYNDQ